jgi:rhodanese-related sulfurtransferase
MTGPSLDKLPGRITFAAASGGAYRTFPANPNIAEPVVRAPELKAMIRDGGELAILDVREKGVFSRGHLFLAVSAPLSRLELRVGSLVPRRSTRIVLCDGGEGLAQRAATRLRLLGYTDLSVLEGGVEAWRQAGYEVFSGVNVPSKAFGEVVEHALDTPRLDPEEVKAKLDAGADMVILDSRPIDEYRKMSIPGALDCPGAELVHRAFGLVKSPETLVVVNCAGRTRSIIGAQSLINAGLPNRVVALKNGTMGWNLAGLRCDSGKETTAPPPDPAGLATAREAAARVAERCGVKRLDRSGLERLRGDRGRTLYLLDVRDPGEFAAGHLSGARSAPGGQLVQATDEYVGTRNARLVLVDTEKVRAPMTASWLVQLGWEEVFVIAQEEAGGALEAGAAAPEVLGLADAGAEAIAPAALDAALKRGEAVVVDVDSSLAYRDAHLPGAWFAIRARLATSLAKLPQGRTLVFTSRDGALARFAAADAQALTQTPVRCLDGGTAAWRAAGLPLTDGDLLWADEHDDEWYRPYDKGGRGEEAMKEYLAWEIDLVGQVERDGDARFRVVRID